MSATSIQISTNATAENASSTNATQDNASSTKHSSTKGLGAKASSTKPFSMPRALRREGKTLLLQQCWNLGRDIKHPDGNALLRFGFTRLRPPEAEIGATTYTFSSTHGAVVSLWGFGFFYGENGHGIYVGRFDFQPQLLATSQPPRAWLPAMIPARAPRGVDERRLVQKLFVDALNWFGDYETWALQTLGAEFRAECLHLWNEPETVAPLEVPARWHALAQRIQTQIQ